ncbi:Alpha/beta hydrolase family protein [Gimesia panareensis]|uniref:Alpha/beta hydrolase family protein n=1 Tax=Gimesia panareensis TaxID=2527978 RepID=A0A517QGI3_9PLAN|nr:hypothetical protein [Gimesia panareensis]QDT30657.1 Alpha/beta hydrolase family protein [Gimesia panareensis]
MMRFPSPLLALVLFVSFPSFVAAQALKLPDPLPGTAPLKLSEPLDEHMVAGIDRYALQALAQSPQLRPEKWNYDFNSHAAFIESIKENRARFKTIIGAVDSRVIGPGFELLSTTEKSSVIAECPAFKVHAVHWQVLDGITASGLLLQPTGEIKARVVALPDADWTPEMFVGLKAGVPKSAQIPLALAARGIQVVIPTLMSRDANFSGHPEVFYTNQPHREFIYRMAFEMGRHVIGYEVQKVMAAVDQFERLDKQDGRILPVGVVGVGEGGLLALFSGAADYRIQSTWVAGYFQQREGVWREPIYRNVWSQLTEFGDAEIAAMIAPRSCVIEACAVPVVDGPPAPKKGQRASAAPGVIEIAKPASVKAEFERALPVFEQLGLQQNLSLVFSGEGTGPAGSGKALADFLFGLRIRQNKKLIPPVELRRTANGIQVDPNARQEQQFNEMNAFTQELLNRSARYRDAEWQPGKYTSVALWEKDADRLRDKVYDELIGRLPAPEQPVPLNVKTRKVLQHDQYQGFEVMLDVTPEFVAGGILLIPNDLKPGERRPVIVCQHGLEGTPMDTIRADGHSYNAYKNFSEQLVKRGLIVYAPQNPYKGRDRFRTLQRKSNPMQRSLYSYIIPQHERTLEWLSSLPFVDRQRIGFYGLSYGGKTAVRVPPFVKQYVFSICSGDFNEWVRKNADSAHRYSYVFHGEYEIFEWNMGHVANYAELSYLMAPRPFMVERGHNDGVAPDEWVAAEYAKVRRFYTQMGIGDRTEIEYFNGPHTINGQGTFAFIFRNLNWKPSGD